MDLNEHKQIYFSSVFNLISAHTNFHDPRTTPSGRKVRTWERKRERKKEREITVLIVVTTFAMQPVCNAARAVHALRLDQKVWELSVTPCSRPMLFQDTWAGQSPCTLGTALLYMLRPWGYSFELRHWKWYRTNVFSLCSCHCNQKSFCVCNKLYIV